MAVEDKTVLTPAEVDVELRELAGWTRDGVRLCRRFTFTRFADITAFLNHLVRVISEQNHHPDFALDTGTRTVSVSVTTHSAKALTRSDLDFARALNSWTPAR